MGDIYIQRNVLMFEKELRQSFRRKESRENVYTQMLASGLGLSALVMATTHSAACPVS